jgi:sarcosine oxidase gamma subunit
MLLVQGRGEMAFMPAVTAVQLHHSAVDIYILTVILLVQGKGEMAVMPAVTAIQLHHSAVDICTDCNVVSTG